MCTYEHLVDATLPHGLIPYVVPQLKTITLGGAVTGLGIESTSFRNGLPHESVLEMDVFTGAGEVVTTRPGEDLFDTFPNSYGSLGYATRIRIRLEEVPDRVELRHVRFDDAGLLAKTVAEIVETRQYDGLQVDGLDGVAFEPGEYYLTLARWLSTVDDEAERRPTVPSDYTGQQVFYRSIQQRETDLLTMHDYLWRWDTDWFWCSGAFGVPEPDDPAAVAEALPALGRLPPADRPQRAHRLHRLGGPPQGPSPAREGDPGRRAAGRAAARVPGLVRRRGRDAAGVAVPAREPGHQQRRPVADLPAAPGDDLRQRRLLGHRPRRPGRRRGPAQPRDRGQGPGARRAQVALLRGLLRPGDLRPALRR